VVRGAGVLD